MQQTHTIFEFVHSLWSGLEGFVEFRLIGKGKTQQFFVPVADVLSKWDEIAEKLKRANRDGANIYFGVNPRTAEVGDAAHVKETRTLQADLDYKDKLFVEKNYEPLKQIGLEPNAIIDSGHGYHLYWFLKDPVDPKDAERVMREVARVLASDTKVTDPPRIMRLPGTLNVKGAPVPCSLLRYVVDKRFNLLDFDPLASVVAGEMPPALKAKLEKTRKVLRPKGASPAAGGGKGIDVAGGFANAFADAAAPYWSEGNRHQLALGVSGLLRKDEIPEAEAIAAMRRLCAMAGDKEIEDRLKALETTYRQPVDEVAGSSIVNEVLGADAKEFFKRYNSALRAIPPDPLERPSMPAFMLYDSLPPGSIFDKYVTYAASRTDAPLQFHLASIIALGAAAMGNDTYVEYYDRRLFATLYVMVTGPSSRFRKSTSINIARKIAEAAKVPKFGHNMTPEQMYAKMATEPCEWREEPQKGGAPPKQIPVAWRGRPFGITFHAEFTHFLDASMKSYMADARSMMMSLYDGYPESRETKSNGRYFIDDAAISLLCGVTPVAVRTFCTKTDVGSGFLSRFLVVMAPEDHVNKFGRTKPDLASVDLAKEIADRVELMGKFKGEVMVTPEADLILIKFEEFLNQKVREVEGTPKAALDPFFARLGAMAIKVAMVYAAGQRLPPVIEADDMKYATAFCSWVAKSMEFFFDQIKPDEGNRELRFRTQVLDAARGIVRKTGDRDILIPHKMLLQFSHMDAEQFHRAVDSLVEEGRLVRGPMGKRGGKTYGLNEVERT